jgi:hypothetical protein
MPDANPPKIFHTPDNAEWTFLQSFADYDKMQEFRHKNQCKTKTYVDVWLRIRFNCNRRWRHNCKFQLLAMKTTKHGFHVYKHGEHNHDPAVVLNSMGMFAVTIFPLLYSLLLKFFKKAKNRPTTNKIWMNKNK